MSVKYYECSECGTVNQGDGPCPTCQAKSSFAAPTGYTAGQRVMMITPERCKGMTGVVKGTSGGGKNLQVQFDGNDYNSYVGSHQVHLPLTRPGHMASLTARTR